MDVRRLAQDLSSFGRGTDTSLVHMTPSEVLSLQSLAEQQGGSLSINPETGLPEAGFLKDLLPVTGEVHPSRKEIEFLQNEYEGTELGFDNCEEWLLNALYKVGDPSELWWQFKRDGHPRYRFTEEYAFGHLHEQEDVQEYMKKYGAMKGHNITRFMGITIPHKPLDTIRAPGGKILSV